MDGKEFPDDRANMTLDDALSVMRNEAAGYSSMRRDLASAAQTMMGEVASLQKQIADLRKEIALDDALLAELDRILDALPCPMHGRCVPHVLSELHRVGLIGGGR